MPQDQSPDRRDYGQADAEPTAAQVFDQVALARRLEVARAQRAEALARREGGAAAPSDGSPAASGGGSIAPATAAPSDAAGRRNRVNAAAQTAFARPAATPPHAAGPAQRNLATTGAALARLAADAIPGSARLDGSPPTVAEPLVAPLRRPAPPRSRGASRAAAATLLILGLVVAAAPPLRERAVDLAAALLPGGVFAGVQLAEPAPPAGPPAPIAGPRLAALPEAPAAGARRAQLPADQAERASAGPPLPALGRPALRADAAPPAEPPQPRLDRLAAMEALAVLTPAEPAAGPVAAGPTRASDPPTPVPPAPVSPDPAVSGLAAAAPVVAGPVATLAASTDVAAPNPATPTRVARAAEPLDIPRPTAADRADAPRAVASARAAAEPPTAGPAAPTGVAAPRTTVAARIDPVATAPVSAPSVAVHAPPSISDAALAATMATLGTARFGAVRSVRVSMTIERTHVRYFHAADAAAARRLAAIVAPGGVAEVRDFTHFSPPPAPGRLEAWLSGATTARRSPPPPRAAPQALPAPPAPLAALPLADPSSKFVIGRQTTVARIRPALPLLQRLYAPPATEVPPAREAPPPPAASAVGAGLY